MDRCTLRQKSSLLQINSLQDVVRDAQNGDLSAQKNLIESVQEELFAFCFYLAKDKASAEDLFQESLLKALKNLSNLEEPEKFKSWLLQIAKNIFLDSRRSQEYRKTLLTDIDKEKPVPASQDINLQIRNALADIPDTDCLILLLIDLHGYSYKETAQMMNLSEEAVTSRVFRARQLFIKKIS